jgi:choline dehydrogenase-like flavoprotein
MSSLKTETYEVTCPDGVDILLTRHPGGKKGPVLLAHGVGVWSGMFALPTIQQNFVQYLYGHGYDVWLLDWRGSIRFPVRQFTFDQVAENDFPAAARFIQEKTRADSIQAVVHCAGAAGFFMSLAEGRLPNVRCVSCSQVALHYDVPTPTRVKSLLGLPSVLNELGLPYLSPTEDPARPVFQALFGKLVDLVHHECTSTICHRLTFMYGHLYRHDQMNASTHDRLETQFGPCNITIFRHLAQLAIRGDARKFDYGCVKNQKYYGSAEPPSYSSGEHLRIPITFVSGALNQTFLPSSTEKTFDWLVSVNGPDLYRRRVIPSYGHIDTFMGTNAHRDTYPVFLEQLESCPS